jgi:hypothetical protein
MSPMADLNEGREPRVRALLLGHVRLGTFNGRYPTQSDTLIFTSTDVERLKPLQRTLGGSIERYEPQGAGTEPWRLVSDADTLTFLFPFADMDGNLSQSWELWGGAGLKRRCDGFTCALIDVDELTGERSEEETPCICAAGERECAPTTRLRLLLPQTGLGIWELVTGSIVGATELYDQVRFISQVAAGRMNHVPIRLVYAQRRISYFDQKERKRKTTNKRIVSLSVAGDAQEALKSLGAAPDRALLAAVETVLSEHALALPSGEASPGTEAGEGAVRTGGETTAQVIGTSAPSSPGEPEDPKDSELATQEQWARAQTMGLTKGLVLKRVRAAIDVGDVDGPVPKTGVEITRDQLAHVIQEHVSIKEER